MSISSKQTEKIKVSGVILVDKPKGMTSQQVVSKVKYLFKSPSHDSKKAGHTGTLDPMATGLLPICMGEATKFSHYQLDADKSYQATILLGQQTDTGDADGQVVIQVPIPKFDDTLLVQIAEQFSGAQQQIPPMYSALKKDGKKLYEYARAGIEIERPPRNIVVKAIDIKAIDAEQIQLTVTCTKGTYVRVLGEDIAKATGTVGQLTALRRTQVVSFTIDKAIDLSALEAMAYTDREAQLMPVDACVDIGATLMLTAEQCTRIHMGQRLNVFEQLTDELKNYMLDSINSQSFLSDEVDLQSSNTDTEIYQESDETESQKVEQFEIPVDIRLTDVEGQFLGLGAVSLNGRLQPKKLIQR